MFNYLIVRCLLRLKEVCVVFFTKCAYIRKKRNTNATLQHHLHNTFHAAHWDAAGGVCNGRTLIAFVFSSRLLKNIKLIRRIQVCSLWRTTLYV